MEQKAPTTPTKRTTVDLHNPTRARRVIYDGIDGSQKEIVVDSGETKSNVELSDVIISELKARTRGRGNENKDLHVYPAGKAPGKEDKDEDEKDAGEDTSKK